MHGAEITHERSDMLMEAPPMKMQATIDGGVDGDGGNGADEEDAEAGKLCKY